MEEGRAPFCAEEDGLILDAEIRRVHWKLDLATKTSEVAEQLEG